MIKNKQQFGQHIKTKIESEIRCGVVRVYCDGAEFAFIKPVITLFLSRKISRSNTDISK